MAITLETIWTGKHTKCVVYCYHTEKKIHLYLKISQHVLLKNHNLQHVVNYLCNNYIKVPSFILRALPRVCLVEIIRFLQSAGS